MQGRDPSWLRLLALALLVAPTACGRTDFDPRSQAEYEKMWDLEDNDPVDGSCDKVDFLFVVDNSASMDDNQENLAASVPGFVAGIEDALAELRSIHVGVITTDGYVHNAAGCSLTGALVVQTGGHNSSARSCGPYAEGHPFMTGADDLDETLGCALAVGTSGSNREQPLTALRRAVSEHMTGPGDCNEGFLRDDALLVTVIVTDEDEPGYGPQTYEHLLDAKYGHDDNIVVVSLVNPMDQTCTPGGHAVLAPEITAFTGWFEHGLLGPICAPDYTPYFDRAVDIVKTACR